MKKVIVLNEKKAMLVALVIFFTMVALTLACAPQKKYGWYKPSSTLQGFANDKYECLQASQQRKSSAMGGFCSGYVCVPASSDSSVVTNTTLFSACMEARGWTLREEKER